MGMSGNSFYTKADSNVHKIEESSCCATSNEVAKILLLIGDGK